MFDFSIINFESNKCNYSNKNPYNFYLVIEVPDHVYVFYAYRLYFADKDIYMIRYFYHKIEITRLLFSKSGDTNDAGPPKKT